MTQRKSQSTHYETRICRDALNAFDVYCSKIYNQKSLANPSGNGMRCVLHGVYTTDINGTLAKLNSRLPKGYELIIEDKYRDVFFNLLLKCTKRTRKPVQVKAPVAAPKGKRVSQPKAPAKAKAAKKPAAKKAAKPKAK